MKIKKIWNHHLGIYFGPSQCPFSRKFDPLVAGWLKKVNFRHTKSDESPCEIKSNKDNKELPRNKSSHVLPKWVFPKIGGKPPKWMVKIMENPIKMDVLGESPLLSETSKWVLRNASRTRTVRQLSWTFQVLPVGNFQFGMFQLGSSYKLILTFMYWCMAISQYVE